MNAYNFLKKRQIDRLHAKAKETTEITKEAILESCIRNDGYETPELNDKLFLHFHWFTKICCLEDYFNVSTLWLSSNSIKVIENLNCLKNLKCLYLDQNCIEEIDNLDELTNLVTLDLSNNLITQIKGLSKLTNLTTFNISKNLLENCPSIESLVECQSIQSLDLSNNKIDDINFTEVLKSLKNLSNLKMSGNPIVRRIKNYRRQLIHENENLGYLDDRPVFDEEKMFVEAFYEGGTEKEKQVRETYQQQKIIDRENEIRNFLEWQQNIRQQGLQDTRCYVSYYTLSEEETNMREDTSRNNRDLDKLSEQIRIVGDGCVQLDQVKNVVEVLETSSGVHVPPPPQILSADDIAPILPDDESPQIIESGESLSDETKVEEPVILSDDDAIEDSLPAGPVNDDLCPELP